MNYKVVDNRRWLSFQRKIYLFQIITGHGFDDLLLYCKCKTKLMLNNSSVVSLGIWVDKNLQGKMSVVEEQRELPWEERGNH